MPWWNQDHTRALVELTGGTRITVLMDDIEDM